MVARGSAYLVLINVPHRKWSHAIDQYPSVIGRSPDAEIRIPSGVHGVSRRHAKVWADPAGCWICDLNSRRGTNINGIWIDRLPRARIVLGDVIWLGGLHLQLVPKVSKLARLHQSSDDPELEAAVPRGPDQPGRAIFRRLTVAEIDIMLWFGRGYENPVEIGDRLDRKSRTVLTQLASIFKKFDVHSRSQLMGLIKRSDAGPWVPSSTIRSR